MPSSDNAFNERQRDFAVEWLDELGLNAPPYARTRRVAFTTEAHHEMVTVTEPEGTHHEIREKTEVQYARLCEVPDWVVAAHEASQVTAYQEHAWEAFLHVVARDTGTQQAIEVVARLGDLDATQKYVLALQRELQEKLASTPFLALMRERQDRRSRRISGRPGFAGDLVKRPSDAAFLQEALPPRVKKKV